MRGIELPNQGRKGVTRTLRIDSEVDGLLRYWSEREGGSISALANRALRRLVEWDMYADRFGFVTIPSASLARIVSELTEDQARAAGSWVGANVWHSFLAFWQGGIDVKTFMKVFPSLVAKYSHLFEYEQREEGGRWTIVLRHHSGRAFSVYAAELVRSLILEFLGTEPRVQATDGLVVIEIELLEARRQRRKMETGRSEIDGRSDDIGHGITR